MPVCSPKGDSSGIQRVHGREGRDGQTSGSSLFTRPPSVRVGSVEENRQRCSVEFSLTEH